MEFFKQIQRYFDTMEQKQFYRVIAIFIGIVLICIIGIMYYYHRKKSAMYDEIHTLNTQREQVRSILERAEKVRLQRTSIDTMLAEDENFKIQGYFEKLLKSLGLSEKVNSIEPTTKNIPGQTYGESMLTVHLTEISMYDLTKLLEAIEQTKRIYTKELAITQSKMPKAIDISLTIATLLPITQRPGIAEES